MKFCIVCGVGFLTNRLNHINIKLSAPYHYVQNSALYLHPKRRAAALVELNNNKTFHVLTLHNNLWLAILFLKALLLHMGLIGIHLFIHIV